MGIGSSFHAQETAVNGQLEKTSCYDKWQYELLLYGICEAVDGEKDPHCLLLAFDIIRALIQLFPDPNGPLENFSGELFETLSSYFPIHFTHPKGEDTDVKRDDLARALMLGGGYLFGLPLGFVADSIGATIGATAAFILGRTIKHAQHLTPGTADRFGELGIIALVQNLEISCLEKNLDMRLGVVTKETKPGLTGC
ncbi:uncharacterized protein LOC133802111 isoform X7 [Humulus lupulus]|uniref:uncharacterized protein LOC133802111 isoform X7 n=1 Tax=Humulus lupulus TaxID=3486 RepID=UPI002B40D025|nr:uncharacterized protein LOC133802111 isoform X7 [Humulus lupulus]